MSRQALLGGSGFEEDGGRMLSKLNAVDPIVILQEQRVGFAVLMAKFFSDLVLKNN